MDTSRVSISFRIMHLLRYVLSYFLAGMLIASFAGCDRTSVKARNPSDREGRSNPSFSVILISREMAESETKEDCRVIAGTQVAAMQLLTLLQGGSSWFPRRNDYRIDHIIAVYGTDPFQKGVGGSLDELLNESFGHLTVYYVTEGKAQLTGGRSLDVSELIASGHPYSPQYKSTSPE